MENVRRSLLVRRPIYSRQVRHRQSLFRTSHRNNLYGHGIWAGKRSKGHKTRKAPAGGSMLYWSCGVTSFFIIIAWRGWEVKVVFSHCCLLLVPQVHEVYQIIPYNFPPIVFLDSVIIPCSVCHFKYFTLQCGTIIVVLHRLKGLDFEGC